MGNWNALHMANGLCKGTRGQPVIAEKGGFGLESSGWSGTDGGCIRHWGHTSPKERNWHELYCHIVCAYICLLSKLRMNWKMTTQSCQSYHMSFSHSDISQARRKCDQKTAYISAKSKWIEVRNNGQFSLWEVHEISWFILFVFFPSFLSDDFYSTKYNTKIQK